MTDIKESKSQLQFYSYHNCNGNPKIKDCYKFEEQNFLNYPCIILIRLNAWNDYGNFTHFNGYYLNNKKNIIDVGTVKIIQNRKNCKTILPECFTILPKNEYFSKGELDYYANLNDLKQLHEIKKDILLALQDVLYNKYSRDQIVNISPILGSKYDESLYRGDNYQILISSDYVKFAIDMLDKIKHFLEVNEENDAFILNLIYGSVVTTLESYLGDAFKYYVLHNKIYYNKFIEQFKPDEIKKYELKELLPYVNNFSAFVDSVVKKNLNKIIFHNLEKVNALYKTVLNVELSPQIFEFSAAIENRHHIFHRNGRSLDNTPLEISNKDIVSLVRKTRFFIVEVEQNIKACTEHNK